MRHGGLVRGHGLFGRSVAKRTVSLKHRSLQLQDVRHVRRLQWRQTARRYHLGTCATAGKHAVSVSGAARVAREGAMGRLRGGVRAKRGQ